MRNRRLVVVVAMAFAFVSTQVAASTQAKNQKQELYFHKNEDCPAYRHFCDDQRGRSSVASQEPAASRKPAGRRVKSVAVAAAPSGALVNKARAYMGTNPTGWSRVWCGRFMGMIAPEAARQLPNPNKARNWASLPRTSLRVGAIAVLSRGRNGGHVGVVSGISPNGNPIIISGNHNGRVGEGEYPRSRVIAYVSPS